MRRFFTPTLAVLRWLRLVPGSWSGSKSESGCEPSVSNITSGSTVSDEEPAARSPLPGTGRMFDS
jgi:hypothetical protein